MKNLFLYCTIFLLASHSVFAGCYTPEQYRAEQAIRFHTNLMVMGLYCKNTLQQNTYATYQDFTRRNQNIIQKQESLLIAYFRQTKQANPEKQFHTMRTDLANRISLQAGQSPTVFCSRLAPFYYQSKTMIPRDFQRWIEQNPLTQPSTQPLCAATQKR